MMMKSATLWIGVFACCLVLLGDTNTAECDDQVPYYPTGKEVFRSNIYRPGQVVPERGQGPIRLGLGPHLFVDDYLIQSSTKVKRRVNRPQRDYQIPNPLVTGKEDHSGQNQVNVIRDPDTGRFRIWYNSYKDQYKDGKSRFATMESADGIHWIRPHQVLNDPGEIVYGCSVLDDGPNVDDPSQRYKLAWWSWTWTRRSPGHNIVSPTGGLTIATSADGLAWTRLKHEPVLYHNHDINDLFRDTLRDHYVAIVSGYTTGPHWSGKRRVTMQSTSKDLINWEAPWFIITPDDPVDKGQTQFYAIGGHLIRGDLWIGLVKVLRDDLVSPGVPKGAYGVGYTTLAWTRDGKHWTRDREPFFEPDPDVNAWDHAHAWLDYQLPVDDEVYIYYGGYKSGHKWNRFEERQIGLVRMKRDRYVSRDAGPEGGTLRTPPVVLAGQTITVNAAVKGELRVELLDGSGKPIPGFAASDCEPLRGDDLAHRVRFKRTLTTLQDKPVHVAFHLRDAKLYGFALVE